MQKIFIPGLLMLLILGFNSCDNDRFYEQNEPIPSFIWKASDKKQFNVEIPEAGKNYHVYINIRHAFIFEWRNLWVKMHTVLPGNDTLSQRINLPLAEADGEWFGSCLGDICDVQVPIQRNALFTESGTYQFIIEQDMREDPLPLIMEVGLRLEIPDEASASVQKSEHAEEQTAFMISR